jgi:hypothetical protein
MSIMREKKEDNGSAVPQMRGRGLRSVLLHMSGPMTTQVWCCRTVIRGAA